MFFTNDYQFLARAACTGEPQIDVIVQLLTLLQEAFELPDWGDHASPITPEFVIREIAESCAQVRRHPESNAALSFVVSSRNVDVRVMVNTGARPLTPTDADGFNFLFNGDFKKPSPTYWLQMLELLRPFMARLGHCKNKNQVEVQERIHRNYPRKPAGCFGLDYYAAPVVANLGGKAHVLKTPAHKTSEFLDGVLIELVPGFYLDPNNPEHLRVQAAAMRHLGIDD